MFLNGASLSSYCCMVCLIERNVSNLTDCDWRINVTLKDKHSFVLYIFIWSQRCTLKITKHQELSRKRGGKVNSEECSLSFCTRLPDRCCSVIKQTAAFFTAVQKPDFTAGGYGHKLFNWSVLTAGRGWWVTVPDTPPSSSCVTNEQQPDRFNFNVNFVFQLENLSLI